jgi:molybdate/tungstate transport system substrate-binding protein
MRKSEVSDLIRSGKKLLAFILPTLILLGCNSKPKTEKLIIFHAGSLSVPFKQIAEEFERIHPNVKVQLEAAGSRRCARKITDLNKPCDIMASADYKVIDNLLIPHYTNWNLKFATNEMVIVFNKHLKQANKINSKNWPNILLNEKLNYGRSESNSYPCGYRTILVNKLAGLYFKRSGLADSILNKDKEYIRPKEVDLLALLESQTIDYAFIYKSIAIQHQLDYIKLPDSINLKRSDLTEFYKSVDVQVSGKKPGETITHIGEPMIYGITQIKNPPNPKLAEEFLKFFFVDSVGIKAMKECGQPPVLTSKTKTYQELPHYLKSFALN